MFLITLKHISDYTLSKYVFELHEQHLNIRKDLKF